MNNNNTGIEFLNKVYKDLNNSEIVNHSSHNKGDKNQKVSKYMDRLERVTMDATKHNKLNLIKEFYYDKYIIKEENIPEAYFELQKKIALERGYGHLEYDKQTKKQKIEHIISEQKSSLEEWLNYFVSEETSYYPTWFKYYTFQGIIKLGAFDKEKGTFSKRTSSTVYPFIELNREAVAFIYSELIKVLGKEQIDDKELETLLNNGSFSKIYGYVIKKLDSINKDDTKSEDGIWKKYNQGSNPEILFNDIHGKGTGWCTAGGIETAKAHINGGDFYVYYTKGSDEKYSKPRIAIRTEYGKIAEIRGVAENQNLESNMEQVVKEKLKEFPDREEYLKKVKDMEMMTYIYTKWQNKGELAKEDLRFIYEIDGKIEGFGYQEDPRIQEIISTRNNISDLNLVFENVTTYDGCLNLSFLTNAEGLELPETIEGDLYLSRLTSVEGLKLPKQIKGDLYLNSLKSAEGLELPESIGGGLNLISLTSAEGLKLPENIGGGLDLRSLTSAEGLKLPKQIKGDLYLNSLKSAEGLELPESIGGGLNLISLTSAEGLKLPENIGGGLDLRSLTSAEGLELPETIEGALYLSRLTSVEGLKLPKQIKGDLCLDSLSSAEGLELPESIGGGLYLDSLTSAKGLKLPKSVGGILNLKSLTSAEGLKLPESIGGGLDLSRLTSVEGLELPESIDGDLDLSSLTSAEGLELPENIVGGLHLNHLTNAEGLKLPKNVGGYLGLMGLTNAKNVIWPEKVGMFVCPLFYDDLEKAKASSLKKK